MKPVEKPRVAVLGLSLAFYEEALPGYMDRLQAQLDKFQEEVSGHADIVSSRLCYANEHVAEETRSAEAQDVDALLLIPMCYTASLMTLLPVARTTLPVVIWNTQEALGITDEYSADDLLMNHVPQGTQDVTNVLLRSGKVFGMESGHYQDQEALRRLGEWLAAARAARRAKEIRVGLLGAPFQDMGDFGVDETLMASLWGPYTIHLTISGFVKRIEEVVDEEIRRLMEQDRERFDIDREVTDEVHSMSSRLEAALRGLVRDNGLDAFSMNFKELMEDGRCPSMPFLGINKLLSDGMGYAGEGNVVIAAHMAQMRQLCGESNFTEIYTVDYARNLMVMTHMQECNPAMARRDRKVRLIRKEFWAPGVEDYVGMHFTLEPGPVTLSTIIPDGKGCFVYIAYETSIRDMAPFEKFDAPHWVIELDEPVGDFLTRYSMAGGPHHLVAVPGERAASLEKLACLQGFDLIRI